MPKVGVRLKYFTTMVGKPLNSMEHSASMREEEKRERAATEVNDVLFP